MVKFLIDNNVPINVSRFLSRYGFDILLINEIDPEIPDRKIIDICKKESRILITNDKDFLYIAKNFPDTDVVIFNYNDQSSKVRIEGLKKILAYLSEGIGLVILE